VLSHANWSEAKRGEAIKTREREVNERKKGKHQTQTSPKRESFKPGGKDASRYLRMRNEERRQSRRSWLGFLVQAAWLCGPSQVRRTDGDKVDAALHQLFLVEVRSQRNDDGEFQGLLCRAGRGLDRSAR